MTTGSSPKRVVSTKLTKNGKIRGRPRKNCDGVRDMPREKKPSPLTFLDVIRATLFVMRGPDYAIGMVAKDKDGERETVDPKELGTVTRRLYRHAKLLGLKK